MNIGGITPKAVTVAPYLLGEDAQGKKRNWGMMEVGTTVSFMFGELKTLRDGFQGQAFVTSEVLYLPASITDISQVKDQASIYSMPITTVLLKAITEDKVIKSGHCYQITYKGKISDKGMATNYDNFDIATYNSEELDKACQERWAELKGSPVPVDKVWKVQPAPEGGQELVEDAQVAPAPAPVAPAPVAPAPAPVAPAPAQVAPAPAPAPVAPAPAPVAPAPAQVAPAPAPAQVAPAQPAPAPAQVAPAPAPAQVAPAPAPAQVAPAPAPAQVAPAPAPAPAPAQPAPVAPAPVVPPFPQ